MAVPGYNVRVPNCPMGSATQISRCCSSSPSRLSPSAFEFQLGLWMHGYEWIDTKNANYTIEGITKENHGPYCRDAARAFEGLPRN